MEVTFASVAYEMPVRTEMYEGSDASFTGVLDADDVEFDCGDDVPAVREFNEEGIQYDPYKITPKSNCGQNFMGWG